MQEQYIIQRINSFITKEMDSVIDVGCSVGSALFPFLERGFSVIKGIDCDESLNDYIFVEYLSSLKAYPQNLKIGGKLVSVIDPNLTNQVAKKYYQEEYKEFRKKFDFLFHKEKGKVEEYLFLENSFDIIILSQVLHFIRNDKVLSIIDRLINALKDNGFIYIDFYTCERLKNGDFGYKFISNNIFEENRTGRFYHLLPIEFINLIRSKFSKTVEIEDKDTRGNIVFVGWK